MLPLTPSHTLVERLLSGIKGPRTSVKILFSKYYFQNIIFKSHLVYLFWGEKKLKYKDASLKILSCYINLSFFLFPHLVFRGTLSPLPFTYIYIVSALLSQRIHWILTLLNHDILSKEFYFFAFNLDSQPDTFVDPIHSFVLSSLMWLKLYSRYPKVISFKISIKVTSLEKLSSLIYESWDEDIRLPFNILLLLYYKRKTRPSTHRGKTTTWGDRQIIKLLS